jgi:pimeloyl-ACP methyl ester carboxylesterase
LPPGSGHATRSDDGAFAELPPAELPSETWFGQVLTGFGTAVDAGVLRAMQIVVDRALIPGPEDREALRESAQPLLDPELQASPRRFFPFLDEPPHELRVRSRVRRRIPGGAVIARRIEGQYLPHSAEIAGSLGPILVDHWVHQPGRPRGTVLLLHGFTMGHPRLDGFLLMASQWFRGGLDVALLTLPHHGARTPPGARFSGEHFAVPHVARLSEAVREAIYEIRQLVHFLREESCAPVGLIGLSLGGYLAALSAGLMGDLDFAVPIVPPVCIGDLAWRFFTQTRHHRAGGEAALSQTELRRAFRVHSPLAHPLRIPAERVMIVAGRGDRIVPPEHPAALWSHWGEPRIHWFSGSHLTPFGRARMARAILDHLESIEIL